MPEEKKTRQVQPDSKNKSPHPQKKKVVEIKVKLGYGPRKVTQVRQQVKQRPILQEGYNPKGIVSARKSSAKKSQAKKPTESKKDQ